MSVIRCKGKMRAPGPGKMQKMAELKRRKQAYEQSERVLSRIGSGRQSREFDLEKEACSFKGPVHMLDSVALKTKHAVFEMVFLGVNESKKLDCQPFLNREPGNRFLLEKGERLKVWSGMLEDKRPFHVFISRMETEGAGNGHIASISIEAQKEQKVNFSKR